MHFSQMFQILIYLKQLEGFRIQADMVSCQAMMTYSGCTLCWSKDHMSTTWNGLRYKKNVFRGLICFNQLLWYQVKYGGHTPMQLKLNFSKKRGDGLNPKALKLIKKTLAKMEEWSFWMEPFSKQGNRERESISSTAHLCYFGGIPSFWISQGHKRDWKLRDDTSPESSQPLIADQKFCGHIGWVHQKVGCCPLPTLRKNLPYTHLESGWLAIPISLGISSSLTIRHLLGRGVALRHLIWTHGFILWTLEIYPCLLLTVATNSQLLVKLDPQSGALNKKYIDINLI